MNLPKKIESGNPYNEIADIVNSWCEKNHYDHFLVTIAVDGEETTEILEFDGGKAEFAWASDWWEGEKDVQLLGFQLIDNIRLYGFPPSDRVGFYTQGNMVAVL